MDKTVRFLKSKCVTAFKNSFLDFSKSKIKEDDLKTSIIEYRKTFFEFFKSKIFFEIYQNFAEEICNEYKLIDHEVLFQEVPTPRVFVPNAHGTNWHCDYWYGHGRKTKTVWVPIKNVFPESTFSAIKNIKENNSLLDFYSQNPKLLTKKFDLKGAESMQVCPPDDSAAIFDSNILHSSTKNTSNLTRLSFDFRFTTEGDSSSTKNFDDYLKFHNGKFKKNSHASENTNFLKYICGGRGISTKSQHILINEICEDLGFNLAGQEAEIERFDYPMLRFHVDEIKNKESQYSGIVIASKGIFNNGELLEIFSKINIPVFFALEQEWL